MALEDERGCPAGLPRRLQLDVLGQVIDVVVQALQGASPGGRVRADQSSGARGPAAQPHSSMTARATRRMSALP